MEASDSVSVVLKAAFAAFNELPAAKVTDYQFSRLGWLKRQLGNILARLQAMTVDLDAGLSVIDLGFDSVDDFEEYLADLTLEVGQLQTLIRALKSLEL